jgi:hypothetical protein
MRSLPAFSDTLLECRNLGKVSACGGSGGSGAHGVCGSNAAVFIMKSWHYLYYPNNTQHLKRIKSIIMENSVFIMENSVFIKDCQEKRGAAVLLKQGIFQ